MAVEPLSAALRDRSGHPRDGKLREILDLSCDEQERLLERLTLHAYCKMRRLTWRGAYVARGGAVPGAHGAPDFASDAIAKALAGQRVWNREIHKTLEDFLRSVIDSDVNHLVDSMDNKKVRRLSSSTESQGTRDHELPAQSLSPLQVVVDADSLSRLREAAMKELHGDEFLPKILECLEAGITEPAEIAILLNVTVDQVNNAKKKLRRRLDKLDLRFKPTAKKRTGS